MRFSVLLTSIKAVLHTYLNNRTHLKNTEYTEHTEINNLKLVYAERSKSPKG